MLLNYRVINNGFETTDWIKFGCQVDLSGCYIRANLHTYLVSQISVVRFSRLHA